MTVAVYGASGWTGSQVARALQRRGLSVMLSGRDAKKLAELGRTLNVPVRAAPLSDAAGLASALSGAEVVVNCAGPFVESGGPIFDAALAVGAHYLDVSGEETHVARMYESAHEPALRRGIAVCPAFAAKGALGDWGAQLAATPSMRARGIDDIAVAYAHGLRQYFRPSVASVLSSAGQGFFRGGGFDPVQYIVERRFFFPPPFGPGLALRVPAAEDVSIPRHLPARQTATYIALAPGDRINEPWARLSLASLPIMPLISRILFSPWGRMHLDLYLPRPESAHDQDSFAVSIEIISGDEVSRLGLVTYDAYASSAEIVALGVLRMLRGAPMPAGVLTPTELCRPEAILRELTRIGAVRVVRFRDGGSQ